MPTILVVDDEPNLLKLVSTMLRTKSYRVLSAADGEEAVRIFAENPDIDLLLTDVIAPGMSGPMIADKVAEMRPGIKVLFMSGYTGSPVVLRYVVEQGHSLIMKPFTLDQLAAKITAVLDGAPKLPIEGRHRRLNSPSFLR